MRALHVVKTADGADWAAAQAAVLVKLGVEVHVALPSERGRAVQKWIDSGATIHIVPTDLPVRSPWLLHRTMRSLRELVANVRPDIIHSHFFGSTVLLRLTLGADHRVPRLFQVPGPLHLEHRFWRTVELSTAGPCDSWIASSRCILAHYRAEGIPEEQLYLSYYGTRSSDYPSNRTGLLRQRYGLAESMKIVGNSNFIYPPKWYLGQRVGLKSHEDVIDALGLVVRKRPDVTGVLIGGTFKGSDSYYRRLQARVAAVGSGRILMTGYVPVEEIRRMWPDFDVAIHVPTSENCGGVIEPMLAGVPTIAGRVGGLPEVVIEGLTGTTVPIRQPKKLACEILRLLDSPDRYQAIAKTAKTLVSAMFDVERTAREVFGIYEHVLKLRRDAPLHFDSLSHLAPAGRHCEYAEVAVSSR